MKDRELALNHYHNQFREISQKHFPHGELEQFQGKEFDAHLTLTTWLRLRLILISIAECNKQTTSHLGIKEDVIRAGYIGAHGEFSLNIYYLPNIPQE